MKRKLRVATIAILILSLSVFGSAFAENNAQVNKELADARKATAKYHKIDAAINAGYVQMGGCLEVPGLGAMGVHYVNFGLLGDGVVDVSNPEVLLYIPNEEGKLRLVGVEYVVTLGEWLGTGHTEEIAPAVFGQTFEGPMDGHGPGEPVHYDKHVWVWSENPSGTFAQFNPNLTCGAAEHESH